MKTMMVRFVSGEKKVAADLVSVADPVADGDVDVDVDGEKSILWTTCSFAGCFLFAAA